MFEVQYLKKELGDQIDFLHVDKHQNFIQVDTIGFGNVVRHAQSTQNNKFAILQYLKKERRDEVDFSHADKRQTFLQVGVINFGGHGQS